MCLNIVFVVSVSKHVVDNESDHDPLILHLDINIDRLASTTPCYKYRPAWSKASKEHIENYKLELQACLQRVDVPYQALFCRDVLCSNIEHITSLNRFSADIVTSCVDAANMTKPLSSCPRVCHTGARDIIPGWSE